MIKLKPYQIEAVEAIRYTFTREFRQYIEMPTGSGKTITFLSYARQYHKKILIIVPSRQLMNQIYESALNFYSACDISRKGDRHNDKIKTLHICIIASIRGDYLEFLANNSFDLTIIDEAHHTQSASYKRLIKRRSEIFHERDMLILGATATPDRSDGQLLKEILYTCSYKLEIYKMIEDGHLSDVEGYSVKTGIDISDVDSHNGDFSLSLLYKKLCTDSRNSMIIDLYIKEMTDRKTLIFCINIAHSKQITQLLNFHGISASHIDGMMKDNERKSILSAFHNGEISVLCNCQLLTEGFDEPSIDGIILARPTRSRSLFLQMIGRGLRTFKGKVNCKIIDIVDGHRSLSGFNSLLTEGFFSEPDSFKSIQDIRDHLSHSLVELSEIKIERTEFFDQNHGSEIEATYSQIKYLDENEIEYFIPLSLDEASFLIWFNEFKKENYGKY